MVLAALRPAPSHVRSTGAPEWHHSRAFRDVDRGRRVGSLTTPPKRPWPQRPAVRGRGAGGTCRWLYEHACGFYEPNASRPAAFALRTLSHRWAHRSTEKQGPPRVGVDGGCVIV